MIDILNVGGFLKYGKSDIEPRLNTEVYPVIMSKISLWTLLSNDLQFPVRGIKELGQGGLSHQSPAIL